MSSEWVGLAATEEEGVRADNGKVDHVGVGEASFFLLAAKRGVVHPFVHPWMPCRQWNRQVG